MNKRKVVEARVRTHLLLGKTITPRQCVALYDGWRLADAIMRLKNKGLKIKTEIVQTPTSSHARYFLADHKNFKNKTVTA